MILCLVQYFINSAGGIAWQANQIAKSSDQDPITREAADEQLVRGVLDDSLDDVQAAEVHGRVWIRRAEHHRHIQIIVIRSPDLQTGRQLSALEKN